MTLCDVQCSHVATTKQLKALLLGLEEPNLIVSYQKQKRGNFTEKHIIVKQY